MNATKRIAKMHDIVRACQLANLRPPDFTKLSGKQLRKMHRKMFR